MINQYSLTKEPGSKLRWLLPLIFIVAVVLFIFLSSSSESKRELTTPQEKEVIENLKKHGN